MSFMKVKIFDYENKWDLESAINDWLDNVYRSVKVIDIKYSGNGNRAPHSVNHWSAMVIYE